MQNASPNEMIERYRHLLVHGPNDARLRQVLHELLAEEQVAAAAAEETPEIR